MVSGSLPKIARLALGVRRASSPSRYFAMSSHVDVGVTNSWQIWKCPLLVTVHRFSVLQWCSNKSTRSSAYSFFPFPLNRWFELVEFPFGTFPCPQQDPRFESKPTGPSLRIGSPRPLRGHLRCEAHPFGCARPFWGDGTLVLPTSPAKMGLLFSVEQLACLFRG